MVSMFSDPYRTPAIPGEDLEDDGGMDKDWDVRKITVVFKFKDEEITKVIEGSVSPEPHDGIVRSEYSPLVFHAEGEINNLLNKGCEKGWLYLGEKDEIVKPWHSFVRADIIKREEKRIAFRWIPTKHHGDDHGEKA